MPPFADGEDSLFFETFNRNKRSVSLDLRHPEARDVFEDLVRGSDVVYSNLRGDQPAKLRLTYDDLKDVNPRIVCCSLSGFGMTGPRAAQGGYDYMMQGLAGWMSLTGDPDGPPTKSGLSLVDLSGGYASAIAVLAGPLACTPRRCRLRLRHLAVRDGHARADVRRHLGGLARLRRRRGGATRRIRRSSRSRTSRPRTAGSSSPVRRRSSGRCSASAIERPDLAEEFPTFADRDRRRDELSPILDEVFRGRTSEEWLEVLGEAGVPCSPVNDVPAALEEARLVEYEHPRLGTVRQVASPLRLSGPEPPARPGPARGEHTEQVLVEVCGYEPVRIRALAESGVFGVESKGDRDAEASAAT